jgi:hypothetical protein
MKNIINTYKQFIIIFLLTVVFFIPADYLSSIVFLHYDNVNYNKFQKGDNNETQQAALFYAPEKNGLTWGANNIFVKAFNLYKTKNIILFGASNIVFGVIPEKLKLPQGWNLINMSALGTDTITDYNVLINYLNKYANHKLNKSDLLVLDINYKVFENSYLMEDNPTHYSMEHLTVKAFIETFGNYKVDSFSETHGSKLTELQKKIYFFKYRVKRIVRKIITPTIETVDFGPNYITIKSYIEYLKGLFNKLFHIKHMHENINMPMLNPPSEYNFTDKIGIKNGLEFKRLLLKLKKQTNVAVINSYINSDYRNSNQNKKYVVFLQTEIIPFLKKENIEFLDLYKSIPDSEFGKDELHLYKKGRERYTDLFNDWINGYINADIFKNTYIQSDS